LAVSSVIIASALVNTISLQDEARLALMIGPKLPYWLTALVVGQILLCTSLSAAIVQTGEVVPDANSWTNFTFGYIGVTSDGSVLVDEGSVLTSRDASLGVDPGVTGTATVSGAGSRWTNSGFSSGNLTVGDSGNGILTIEEGGIVTNNIAYLGRDSGSTGTATVTGAGSKWINSNWLYVGNSGDGTLTIEGGGEVSSPVGAVGHDPGSIGTATVTGVESRWTNSGSLWIGNSGNGTLTIEAGGQVSSTSGSLGTDAGSIGTAMVTGVGSRWDSGSVFIGYHGNGTLIVKAGGQVVSPHASGYLGYLSGSTGTATVTGTGSSWTTGLITVGGWGSGTLTVSDGGEVVTAELLASLSDLYGNGTITATHGAVLDADLVFDGTHGNQTSVSFGSGGTLTVHTGGWILGAGYKQSGSLNVSDGVNITSSRGYLGYNSGSTGAAIVSGAGSSWTNSSHLYVGRQGHGSLTIEAGGQVSNTSGSLGSFPGSAGSAKVAGDTSSWANSGFLLVGSSGNGTLTIEDGGQVSSSRGYLGDNTGTTGTVTITGAGSKWTNSGELYVGQSGEGTLTIEAGGKLVSNGINLYSYLGFSTVSTGTATVSGAGSSWTNSSRLYVGNNGHGHLSIEAGGQVSNTLGLLGYNSGSTGAVEVNGPDSRWSNSSELYVGRNGHGFLTIEEGARVSSRDGYLGFGELGDTSSSAGSTIVTGEGSMWTNTRELYVGRRGSGTLMIDSGGKVTNRTGYVGDFGSSGNTATVTVRGHGSMWTNSNDLYVGRNSHGTNALTIEAGGQVSNITGYLGYWAHVMATATVTGEGSSWANEGELYVGQNGNGTLTIEAGGQVSNTNGYLALNASSTSTATVTGTGSKWTNSGELYVGRDGSGSLTITNGGLVTVGGTLSIAANENSDGVINMASGGMLALWGEADQSLAAFLDLISGTGQIRFWNASLEDWAPLTTATYGEDYTLEHLTTGELTGYTLLTVGTLGDFDFNGDGIVDGHDFLAWQRNSHLGDLAGWETAFGNTTSQVSPSSTIVPEPSALWLVAAGGMLLFPSRLLKKCREGRL